MAGEDLEHRLVDLATLVPHPRNYKQYPPKQIAKLKASLQRFGQRKDIVIQPGPVKSLIVAGHGIVIAAQELGWTRLSAAIIPQDWPEDAVSGYMVADNETSNDAEDNDVLLAEILQEQKNAGFDLESLGWDEEEFQSFLEELGNETLDIPDETVNSEEDDEIDPDSIEIRCKRGELWKLGNHYLLVDDCTKPENVTRLLQGKKAAIAFTSPPYNAAKNSSLPNKDKYLHDEDKLDETGYLNLLISFTSLGIQHCNYVFVNVQSLSGNKLALIDYLYQFKTNYADTIIWDKLTAEPAMAKNVLNSQYEYVHVFSEKATRAIGTKEFRGTLSNVFSLNSRQDKQYSDVHKATFPVAFAMHFIGEFSQRGDICYEPFCGSGTTIIAAERLERHCYACEIDEKYASVILARWEAETAQTAELMEPVEEVSYA
jgi:DNA modification methylase